LSYCKPDFYPERKVGPDRSPKRQSVPAATILPRPERQHRIETPLWCLSVPAGFLDGQFCGSLLPFGLDFGLLMCYLCQRAAICGGGLDDGDS
jgi:hypothetical protein